MKKIFLLLSLITLSIAAFSQGPPYPNFQRQGNVQTRWYQEGAVHGGKGLINGVYPDTIFANLGYQDFYPGAQIVTYKMPLDSGTLWLRNWNATKWLRGSGSIDISSITFLTDSSVVICFGNGVCDTIAMNNFTTVVNNIVQNFNDSTIFNINDSTIIICNAAGSCDTIDLGTTNTYNIFFDTTSNSYFLVTCDTVQNICVGDSCYQQQVCDTIAIPALVSTFYQNALFKQNNIVEHGAPIEGNHQSELIHDTYLFTNGFQYSLTGRPTQREVFRIKNTSWTQLSSSIASLNHYGAYHPGWGLLDENNPVKLYFNYTDPFAIPTQGSLSGDTVGFMGSRYGYMLMTNAQGVQGGFTIDDVNAKQVGIFFDTYSDNTEGVSIFAQRVPSGYNLNTNPPTDSTLLSKRVAIFKTDKTVQITGYPDTRDDGTTSKALFTDADGNIKLGTITGTGDIITIINDTTINICSFGTNLCDTIVINNIGVIQTVFVLNDTTLVVCDSIGVCDTLIISSTQFSQPITARNGLIMATPTEVQFGQGIGAPGNPAILLSHREVPLANFTINFNAAAGQTNNMMVWKNPAAAIRARITSAASFSNTGGQTGAEIFGDGASVAAANSIAIGNTASVGSGGAGIAIGQGATIANGISGNILIGIASSQTTFGFATIVGSAITSTGRSTGIGYGSSYSNQNNFGIGEQVVVAHLYSGALGFGATTTANNQVVFGASINSGTEGGLNDIYWGEGVLSPAPDNVSLNANSGSGTNIAGGNISYNASRATGNAATGVHIFQTSTVGASGTTLQTLAPKIQINGSGILAYNGVMPTTGSGGTDSAIFRNSSTGQYYLAPGSAVITADNALTKSTATNVQLGATSSGSANSPLLHNTYINTTASYRLVVYGEGTTTVPSFEVSNFSGGVASKIWTTNSTALWAQSNSGIPLYSLQTNSGSLNAATELLSIDRGTQSISSAQNGIGSYIGFHIESSTTAGVLANQIISQLTDVTHATRTSTMTLTGLFSTATVDLLTLAGNGSVKLRPITATAASAITPAEGMLVFVSNTDATFTTVGIWCYQNGAWKAL